MSRDKITIDGNEAAACTAYHVNEVITIYPITPSSPMSELADQWVVEGRPNIWGTVPQVTEMKSEVGAPDAERVITLMGSAAETAQETVECLVERGEKVDLLKVSLYRSFSVKHFVETLPKTVRTIATLGRSILSKGNCVFFVIDA
jgi:pyruvate-ferredoxin/flavodoxin oxidoreductase